MTGLTRVFDNVCDNAFSRFASSLANWMYGLNSTLGLTRRMSTTQALTYAPIWSACQKIGGHIAQLPKDVYERVDGGGEKQRSHPTARLLRKPCTYQVGSIFYETMALHSLIEGNGRAAIIPTGTMDCYGEPSQRTEVIPLRPNNTWTGMIAGQKVHTTRPARDDRLRIFVQDVDGQYGTEGLIPLDDSQVVHILGLSDDGVVGIPLTSIAYRNLNASINTEKRFANQMEKGFSGSLMLEAPTGVFRDEAEAKEFLEWFEKRHNDPEKAGKTGMLREGIKANILSGSNKDSEMLQTRVFQRQDAALWMGLEDILGDGESTSYNSLEQKNLAYLQNCLNRWIRRWEEELAFKLLPKRQYNRDTHYIKFNTAALMRSDWPTTVQTLSTAISATIMNPNEARERLDMLPYVGGDIYGNPATSSGATGISEEGAEEITQTDIDMAPNAAAVARVRHLVRVEANRMKQGTSKPNFIEFMDSFYAHWEAKLADCLEEIGCDRDNASAHCEESKLRLLEVCDTATEETLASKVAECVSNWENRAEKLVEENRCLIAT